MYLSGSSKGSMEHDIVGMFVEPFKMLCVKRATLNL